MKPTLTVKAITKKQMEDDLVAASQSGDADKVCQLIANGVDIHAADDHAMQIAVDKGYADVLNVLLAADAAEKTGKPSKGEHSLAMVLMFAILFALSVIIWNLL